MQDLKLIALDQEDLRVVSAHLQDAVVKVADIAYLPGQMRFAALVNRFNWSTSQGAAPARRSSYGTNTRGTNTRHRSALRVERVCTARTLHLDLDAKHQVLALLAIQFDPDGEDDPAGRLTLVFSGGAAIELTVECIEVALQDIGGAWATTSRPDHSDAVDTTSK